MANNNFFAGINDQELIVKIKENPDFLGLVYKNCKKNAIRFMLSMSNGSIKDYELEDIIHDAIIVLYEKIITNDFVLTCAIQTYLNSVCRFQLLNKLGNNKKTTEFEDSQDDDGEENALSYKSYISDSLEIIEDSKEAKYIAIERALELIEAAGGHCYELLTLFWYHKKSMTELTEIFGYSNKENTKQQKAKCQKRLEKIAFNEMKK